MYLASWNHFHADMYECVLVSASVCVCINSRAMNN